MRRRKKATTAAGQAPRSVGRTDLSDPACHRRVLTRNDEDGEPLELSLRASAPAWLRDDVPSRISAHRDKPFLRHNRDRPALWRPIGPFPPGSRPEPDCPAHVVRPNRPHTPKSMNEPRQTLSRGYVQRRHPRAHQCHIPPPPTARRSSATSAAWHRECFRQTTGP
jgi:hypothetical protein